MSPQIGLAPTQPHVPLGGFPASTSSRPSAFRPTLSVEGTAPTMPRMANKPATRLGTIVSQDAETLKQIESK